MKSPKLPRKEPRQQRSRELVEAILVAATRVFEAKGYTGTTTNEIARVAGVSIGSLYQYFPDKDALVTALHEQHRQQSLQCIRHALQVSQDEPLEEKLTHVVDELLKIHENSPQLQRILHQQLNGLRVTDEQSAIEPEFSRLTQTFLERHLEGTGERDTIDTALRARTLLQIGESLVHEFVLNPPPRPRNEIIASIVQPMLGVVFPRASPVDRQGGG